jgi:DNA processing protein
MRAARLGEDGYPRGLCDLAKPPVVVFLLGPWAPRRPTVAIVGARDATPDGCDVAGLLAADLARSGVDVLSGLARGIDSCAHRGALEAGGRSGAVLGTGIGRAYPRENAALYERLSTSLGLLSELPPGAAASRATFASRNRLLAALADAVVVVQGREGSGSLITARAALKLGRPIGAYPWDGREPLGAAPHALLRAREAALVRSAADVLELLPGPDPGGAPARGAAGPEPEPGPGRGPALRPFAGPPAPAPASLSPEAARLLGALRERATALDEIAERAALGAGALASALSQLELAGLARREPGGRARLLRR